MSDLRCTLCHHIYAIHARDGTCPRWARAPGSTLNSDATRVILRIGARWYARAEHGLGYLVECVDDGAGIVLAWDLTEDQYVEVPIVTVQKPHTRAPTNAERDHLVPQLELSLGTKVRLVRKYR